ncbi:Protein of unknown function [Cotesia congregata]|uniref:Uncharacterized protein n=1 Tax=Cotesia congregata TaxID=51543 RepID=A0A8J2HBS3_COTCN|nr:Protein of unknown function [Cotesia congregata]CAG5093283.1 Protein of unknown function [Cotesia congregata]
MEIILDMQEFRGPHNKFIMKEFASITIQNEINGVEEITPTLFQQPYHWKSQSKHYQRFNTWITRNHYGLSWDTGNIPYCDINKVINYTTHDKKYIYVKGVEKKLWLQAFIASDKNIIDLEDFEFPTLKDNNIYDYCSHHYNLNKNMFVYYSCALKKCEISKQNCL